MNYGLPVWVYDGQEKQYDGWLGALVNTWQEGDSLKGDTNDLADINAKRIADWQTDNLPIYEPGLDEVVKSDC